MPFCTVLNEAGRAESLNHMFYPNGGGNTVTRVSLAGEEGFIVIEALVTSVLKPLKLRFESFGVAPQWNYFRLEAETVASTDMSAPTTTRSRSPRSSQVCTPPVTFGTTSRSYRPARPVLRYLRGSFVIFSTMSPYNADPSTYDARHEKMGEKGFREYIRRNALHHSSAPNT